MPLRTASASSAIIRRCAVANSAAAVSGLKPAMFKVTDAVFNVGRVAMLVGALAAGDVGALRLAMEDRLHQPARLAAAVRRRRPVA